MLDPLNDTRSVLWCGRHEAPNAAVLNTEDKHIQQYKTVTKGLMSYLGSLYSLCFSSLFGTGFVLLFGLGTNASDTVTSLTLDIEEFHHSVLLDGIDTVRIMSSSHIPHCFRSFIHYWLFCCERTKTAGLHRSPAWTGLFNYLWVWTQMRIISFFKT